MWMPTHSRRGLRMSASVGMVPIPAMVPSRTRFRGMAAVIPGDSVVESTITGGLFNFFNIYQNVIVARILLSWFPGLAQQPVLRPLYTICDPFLNAFRSVVPPIFGIDLSPIVAIFLLQTLGTASIAVGAEMPRGGASSSPVVRNPRNRLPFDLSFLKKRFDN